MKRSMVAQMKMADPKRLKIIRAIPKPYNNIKKLESPDSSENFGELISKILKSINDKDTKIKSVIVNIALKNFMNGKKHENAKYVKYLRNFNKFSVLSLLYSAKFINSISSISNENIKTFIYLFIGSNIVYSKYFDDYCVWNSNYITLWGLNCKQIGQIEEFVLKKMNYQVDVDIYDISRILLNAFNILENK